MVYYSNVTTDSLTKHSCSYYIFMCESGCGHCSIGVCYIGGKERRIPGVAYKNLKDKDTRTDAQKVALLNLLLTLKKLYPAAKIYGHRDFDMHGKTCPCFDAKKEYSNI